MIETESGAGERAFGERAFLVAVSFSALGRSRTGRRSAGSAPSAGGNMSGKPAGKLGRTAAQARSAAHPASDAELLELLGSELPDSDLSGPELPDTKPWSITGELDAEATQAEFRELVESAGGQIVGEMGQRRPRPDPATLLGRGKLEELAAAAAAADAELILFDYDLSPTQLRNLEAALPCPVVDRTQLILDIFARHARTREGQLQVELAQLEYMLPRLTGRGRAMSQLGGGIGTRGPGETQLETDRRRIARRLVQLRRELDAVRRVRRQQRSRRESAPVPTVALVGYTNAGKSTLFNRLTGAGVLASSQMFATLDPKLRAIVLPSRRKILLSDTVGFIRDLPHTLVTSFRATLEEVEKAEVLLHVQDAAHPNRAVHKAEVEKVLSDLGVLDTPRIEVWNKLDLLDREARAELTGSRNASESTLTPARKTGSGSGVGVSARESEGIEALLAALDAALVADPVVEQWLAVPQSSGQVLAALEAGGVMLARAFVGETAQLLVAAPRSLLGRYRRYWTEIQDGFQGRGPEDATGERSS